MLIPVTAARAAVTGDCYDTIVVAQLVAQVPSELPECENCIVMRWPWFWEVEVRRSVMGDVPRGRLIVQTIQHGFYVRWKRPKRLWLRRNALGGYNLVAHGRRYDAVACPAGSGLERPYYRPAQGETIADAMERNRRALDAD